MSDDFISALETREDYERAIGYGSTASEFSPLMQSKVTTAFPFFWRRQVTDRLATTQDSDLITLCGGWVTESGRLSGSDKNETLVQVAMKGEKGGLLFMWT
jgi:hypothetical protein